MECFPNTTDTRHNLWTNHPGACGAEDDCDCGIPGLVMDGASLSTEGWIVSTLLNMLMTSGKKPDSECGWNPAGRGGHWSESYITNGPAVVGSQIQNIGQKGRVEELRALLVAHVQQTVARLQSRGVASKVEVSGEYAGSGKFRLNISVFGTRSDPSKVGFTAERLENGWVWSNV